MCKFKCSSMALALWLMAAVVPCLADGDDEAPESRLDTYSTTDGTPYFALRLVPNIAVPAASGNDVVVLFDTSASQTSVYRDKALVTLDNLLSRLHGNDRVSLMAVNLEAVPLTNGFVRPAAKK